MRPSWWLWLAGGAIGAWVLAGRRSSAPSGGGEPDAPVPEGPDTRARAWQEIGGSPIWLARGVRYRACVDLPFGVGVLATDARVTSALEREGFESVTIRRDVDGCDLLLEATWAREPMARARPSQVTGAWGFFLVDG